MWCVPDQLELVTNEEAQAQTLSGRDRFLETLTESERNLFTSWESTGKKPQELGNRPMSSWRVFMNR
jgi:hypothetical protein